MKSLFMTLLLVLMLVLLIGSAYLVYEEQTFIMQSRAKKVEEVSSSNSLVVSTPTCVPADGESVERLHIYCLSGRGIGLPEMLVTVSPTAAVQGIQIQPVQGTTDQSGRAIFDLTSTQQGVFDLTVLCGDTQVKTNHHACFQN